MQTSFWDEQDTEDDTLINHIQEKKELAKKDASDRINEILKHKDAILKSLLQSRHWMPEPDALPTNWWLAGRGNPCLKTHDGIAKIALIGLYPGREEIHHKPAPAVMVGPSGRFLDKILSYCIDDPNTVYRTNLIKHYKKAKSKLGAEEKTIGRQILLEELTQLGITHAICLGTEVYNTLCRDKERFPATAFRGIFLPKNKATIPLLFTGLPNPAAVMTGKGQEAQAFETHIRNLFATLLHGEQQRVTPKFKDIQNASGAHAWAMQFFKTLHKNKTNGKKTLLAIDTETTTSINAGNLKPEETILISTAYGAEDAHNIQDLNLHTWTFLKTPDWEYQTSSNIRKQNELDLSINPETENTEESIPNRANLIIPPEEHPHETKQMLQWHWDRGTDTACLHLANIQKTPLDSPKGRNLIHNILTAAIHDTDEVILQHGHFDKEALEKAINLDWDALCHETNPETGQETLSGKFKELMVETVALNENDPRGLKDAAAGTLNWPNYDIALELFKADHDITSYLHIPWSVLASYAALDAAATLLIKIKKELTRKKKATHYSKYLENYSNNLQKITGTRQYNPSYNPEYIAGLLNRSMQPLYQIKKAGMPIGTEGMKKVAALIDYYREHYEKLKTETANMSQNLTGVRLNDPGSTDQVCHILYGPRDKGGLELEPFREPGAEGRLWENLSANERNAAKGTGAIDTESFAVLKTRAPNPETAAFIKKLGQTRQIKSIGDNFFADPKKTTKGFFNRIDKDLRLHTEYMPTTDTLRFRSHPNLANPPKDETGWVTEITGQPPPCELRNCITADNGWILHCRDWSSAEVHLLMHLSNDPTGLDIIHRNLDFHIRIGLTCNQTLQTAFHHWKTKAPELMEHINQTNSQKKTELLTLAQSSKEKDAYSLLKALFKNIRNNIKPITFGVSYGQTAEGFARVNGMSIEEANTYILGYQTTYAKAWEYLQYQGRFATTCRSLPSPWGYIRNFSPRQNDDDVQRQAFNLQPQHGVAIMALQAIIDWDLIKRRYKLKSEIFLSLYDALGWHGPESEAQNLAEITHDLMTTNRPVGPLNPATIPTEGSFSHFWEGPSIKSITGPSLI
jgi:uracil-DNA glycosylase